MSYVHIYEEVLEKASRRINFFYKNIWQTLPWQRDIFLTACGSLNFAIFDNQAEMLWIFSPNENHAA